jgi:hypothetical protein
MENKSAVVGPVPFDTVGVAFQAAPSKCLEALKARQTSVRREERGGGVVFIWADPSWLKGARQ